MWAESCDSDIDHNRHRSAGITDAPVYDGALAV